MLNLINGGMHKICTGNINEHRAHTSKNSEHGKPTMLPKCNGLKFVQKAEKPLFMRVAAEFSLARLVSITSAN